MEITREKFRMYRAVQNSGITNMFDVKRVCELSGLDRAEVIEIMQSYEELAEKFNQ